ncbi:MAG: polymer-forming cytoskeletal protein, partial [Myxococcota bacterium]|nr:polymer-forming cytoskeletal protein [Myxococcota bacterium]
MDETQVFTIPAGLSLESRGDGFTVAYEGDIVLHDSLDDRIREVRSSAGDVRIHADLTLDQIDAPGGTVRCFGSLRVGMIHADRIEIHGDIEASNLVANDTIDLDGDCTVGDVRAQSVVLMGAR